MLEPDRGGPYTALLSQERPRHGATTKIALAAMTFASFNPPARILMGPGPADLHPRVLAALSRPTIGHRADTATALQAVDAALAD